MCNSPDCKCPIDYEKMTTSELYELLPEDEKQSIHNWVASGFTFKELCSAWGGIFADRCRGNGKETEVIEEELNKEFDEIDAEIINILKQN